MGFKTDGSSHHNGVANEHATVNFINEKSTTIRAAIVPTGHSLVQVGGTKTKIDARVIDHDGNCIEKFAISIKNHKGKNGTFDWINTTEHAESVKSALKEFKAAGRADRKKFNAVFATHLKQVGDGVIKSLLTKCATENPPWLIINNGQTKEYILAATPDLTPLANWNYFLKFGRGVTSAQIWRRRGSVEVNTNLRLRLVSNNGLKALFEAKGSVPCFKLQQEHVKDFIESLVAPVRETWT
jgi:hypothetical protein